MLDLLYRLDWIDKSGLFKCVQQDIVYLYILSIYLFVYKFFIPEKLVFPFHWQNTLRPRLT